jgi:dTDP-4-amino-4,6-dideoxygalactose transaminase
MEYWSTRYGFEPEDFPEALDKFERSISLPIWQGMSAGQVERVIGAVREAAAAFAAPAAGS